MHLVARIVSSLASHCQEKASLEQEAKAGPLVGKSAGLTPSSRGDGDDDGGSGPGGDDDGGDDDASPSGLRPRSSRRSPAP